MKSINILGRSIGFGHGAYIIAEMSANHGHSLENAMQVVRAAKEAGADAIKLQTYTPDTLTINSERPEFLMGQDTLWAGRNLYDLYAEAYTPWEWQPELKKEAERLGMHCFSTPFDNTAVDFLERVEVPAHKIASFELVDTQLLKKVAATGKPVIMSTGMATFEEISEAVQTLRLAGCSQLALLKCTSAYPSMPEDMNLLTIPHLAKSFGPSGTFRSHSRHRCARDSGSIGRVHYRKASHLTSQRWWSRWGLLLGTRGIPCNGGCRSHGGKSYRPHQLRNNAKGKNEPWI
jgi:sialic acid synthase SpsE